MKPKLGHDALTIADYEEVLADKRRLVRELDVLMNGKQAAKQASLCDIVGQFPSWKAKALRAERSAMRRVVRAMKTKCEAGHRTEPHTRATNSQCDMYQLACDDLLAALRRRR